MIGLAYMLFCYAILTVIHQKYIHKTDYAKVALVFDLE